MKQAIRFITLFFGLVLGFYITFLNYESLDFLLLQVIMMFIWLMIPFYSYFFISGRSKNMPFIIIPSLFIIIPYAYFTYYYLTSESSTSALIFAAAPVYGMASMGLGYLIAWISGKIFNI